MFLAPSSGDLPYASLAAAAASLYSAALAALVVAWPCAWGVLYSTAAAAICDAVVATEVRYFWITLELLAGAPEVCSTRCLLGVTDILL